MSEYCRFPEKTYSILTVVLVVQLLTVTGVFSAPPPAYKEYRPVRTKTVLLDIYTDYSHLELRLPDSTAPAVTRYPLRSLQ
ncbi:MAG: hypothetical protein D6800_09275, partial [Candidatus Zixiibacteriota bacterium]